MKILFISLFLFCFSSRQTETVADKIIAYSLQNMDKQVDRGECWDLAAGALKEAGAKWNAPFDFGTKIDRKKKSLQPADILQFTNAKFQGKTYSSFFPQHTAIVYKVNKSFTTVFHQNYNGKRQVDTLTINLADLKSGKVDAYRPVAK
ncbi:MAG: CHAP domain-containing protein [Bacteroidota bacterium]|nr:CHAP domain-containing protein [Bacteroidota bacterium]